jgi:hypothetical protein
MGWLRRSLESLRQAESWRPAKSASCLLEACQMVRTSRLLDCLENQVLAVAEGPPCCSTAMPALVMVAAGSAAFSFRARS